MKLLSADTTLDAQLFLVNGLKRMEPARRLEITAAAIAAGLGIRRLELREMDPFEVAGRVTTIFEREGTEHFVGGSLASTVYGEPRFTQDVDIIVRLNREVAAKLAKELGKEFYVNEIALDEALARKSCANLIHLGTNFKVDLMISKDRDYESQVFARKRRIEVGERGFYFCSPEDIILAKLEWYKASGGVLERQLRDIQTVMMVQAELDFEYLRFWADNLGVRGRLEASLIESGLRD